MVAEPKTVYWLGNSLYLNITNRCSNNCWFCFRNFKKGVGDFNLKLTDEPSASTIVAELEKVFVPGRWTEVVFCGFGEPTERLELLLEVAQWIHEKCPTIKIRLDTNGHGYILNKGKNVVQELKAAGVQSVSVCLNGHDEESYRENCRPSFAGAFEAVLNFVRQAKAEMDVEVSAVRMPEVEVEKVKAATASLGVKFRVREYIPCFW